MNFLSIVGALTISWIMYEALKFLYIYFKTGKTPVTLQLIAQEAKDEALCSKYESRIAFEGRRFLSTIAQLEASKIYLEKRTKDLEADITDLRKARDNVEDAFVTFLTSLKRD